MKLRNKKTGEIIDLTEGFIEDTCNGSMIQIKPVAISNKEEYVYGSLAELNEEWEDYEGPKELWFIAHDGSICSSRSDLFTKEWEKLGLTFETKEEAEKAVEKLKAWKRLKDAGFRFTGYTSKDRGTITEFEIYCDTGKPCIDRDEFTDLDLLFGGEE